MDLSDIFQGLFVLFIIFQVVTSFGKKSGKKAPKNRGLQQKAKPATKQQMSDFEARIEEARRHVREAMSENSPSHKAEQHVGTERSDELFHGKQVFEHSELPEGLSKKAVTPSHSSSLPQGMSGHLSQGGVVQQGQHVALPGGLSGHNTTARHQALPQGLSGHMSSKYFKPELEVGIDKLETHRAKHVKLKHYSKKLTAKKKKTVKLKGSVVRMDPDSIVSGIIWHQILAEPKFKQNWRNQ